MANNLAVVTVFTNTPCRFVSLVHAILTSILVSAGLVRSPDLFNFNSTHNVHYSLPIWPLIKSYSRLVLPSCGWHCPLWVWCYSQLYIEAEYYLSDATLAIHLLDYHMSPTTILASIVITCSTFDPTYNVWLNHKWPSCWEVIVTFMAAIWLCGDNHNTTVLSETWTHSHS